MGVDQPECGSNASVALIPSPGVVEESVFVSALVYRARGFRDGAPRVQGVPTAIAPFKDLGNLQSIFFLVPCGDPIAWRLRIRTLAKIQAKMSIAGLWVAIW
jgi:hypothetical protein